MTSTRLDLPPPRRVLVPLGLGTAISLVGDGTLYTVLPHPDVAAQAGVSLAMVGVLLGINRVTRLVSNGLVGMLYDRMPRRGVLIASLFLGALSTAVFAVGVGPAPLLLSRILWGVAWSGIWIGGYTMVLDISDDHNRGRLSGQFQMWFFWGVAGASLLGGLFTDLFGFRGSLLLDAGLIALAALMWLAFLPETRPVRDAQTATAKESPPQTPFPWRGMLAAALPLFASRFVTAGVLASTSILWLGRFFSTGTTLLGVAFPLATLTGSVVAARTLASIGGAPAAGWLSDRLGRRWLVVAGGTLAGAVGIWLMGGLALVPALVGALLAAIATASVQAMVPALAGDRVGTARRGRALSVAFTFGDLGSALGPIFALTLLGVLSLGAVYRLTALTYVVVTAFALWQSRGERGWRPRTA